MMQPQMMRMQPQLQPQLQPQNYAQVREERIRLVHEWQQVYNMEPRADSKHRDVREWPSREHGADQVARELMATDYLYKHTLYGDLIEEFLRRVAAVVREQHGLSWTATWNVARFYGADRSETHLPFTGRHVHPPVSASGGGRQLPQRKGRQNVREGKGRGGRRRGERRKLFLVGMCKHHSPRLSASHIQNDSHRVRVQRPRTPSRKSRNSPMLVRTPRTRQRRFVTKRSPVKKKLSFPSPVRKFPTQKRSRRPTTSRRRRQ